MFKQLTIVMTHIAAVWPHSATVIHLWNALPRQRKSSVLLKERIVACYVIISRMFFC